MLHPRLIWNCASAISFAAGLLCAPAAAPAPPAPVILEIPGLPASARRLELLALPGAEKSVLMGRFEVTQAQFESVMRTNPSCSKASPDHPVERVSWNDAREFCAALTRLLPPDRLNQTVRLPSDAEWSLAAGLPAESGATPKEKHMGVKGVYPWGSEWPPPAGAGNYEASLKLHSFDGTAPVGSFKPLPSGFHDLGGNVWEWCDDRFDPPAEARVLRGAAWVSGYPDHLLSSYRGRYAPTARDCGVGFRVLVSP